MIDVNTIIPEEGISVYDFFKKVHTLYKQEAERAVYKITRLNDKKEILGNTLIWIGRSKDGNSIEVFKYPAVGRRLVVDFYSSSTYTWLTTDITHIKTFSPNLIEFDTSNSSYKIEKNPS
jgi:hypothetical protein